MTTLAEGHALGGPVIERTVRKTVPCRECECPLDRSTTLRRVQNPRAKRPISIESHCAELREQAATWWPTNDICPACAKDAEPDQNASST